VAGLAEPARRNLYPVDLDVLVERHALLGMSREQLLEKLPALRGQGPTPVFGDESRRVPIGMTESRFLDSAPSALRSE
jgi:hypothetical protein